MKKSALALFLAAALPLSVSASVSPAPASSDPGDAVLSQDEIAIVPCRVEQTPNGAFYCDDGRLCREPADTRHGTVAECHPDAASTTPSAP